MKKTADKKTDDNRAVRADMLWSDYLSDSTDERASLALIEYYLPLVHSIIGRMAVYLPSHMDMSDLQQHGLIGLCEAIGSYDNKRGVRFETFAYHRIRGAVLDVLRKADNLSRSNRKVLKQLAEVATDYIEQHGYAPDTAEMAEAAGMTTDDVRNLLQRAQPWLSLDQVMEVNDGQQTTLADLIADESAPDPGRQAAARDCRMLLRRALRWLPLRQQKMLYLYYFEEMTLKEIANLFEISEARVCQLHATSLMALRVRLRDAG